jgi:hypothetical protein
MEQVHLALPYSMPLSDTLPQLADPFAAPLVMGSKMQARVRLSDGWHMLNQARLALIEAEACTIFYEEIQKSHTEALYHCRYFLDDAALRLYSCCEFMWKSIVLHLSLSIPKKGPRGILARVIKAAKQSGQSQLSMGIAEFLEQLQSSTAFEKCMNHRNDWVHNRLPATGGLSPDIRFETVDGEAAFPPEVLERFGLKKDQKLKRMSLGNGPDIGALCETIRDAYGALFQAYEGLANLLAAENRAS